jgi:hypothetical protein
MLTVASLLAAMTIAGAFWVGVLAARRLRDWGDGRRALEESEAPPLALAAPSGAPAADPATERVRALVAARLQGRLQHGGKVAPRELSVDDELGLASLREGDVIVVDAAEPALDGDYIAEGLVHLREGGETTVVVIMADASRRRWLVGATETERWMLLEPAAVHGLRGEPPRNIQRDSGQYALERRGQASAATVGRHGRPEGARAGTYLYRASAQDVLWVERWGDDVLMGVGRLIPSHTVSFLPGS